MKKRAGKETDGRKKLNRNFLRRWLRGQRVMNRSTEEGRRAPNKVQRETSTKKTR